MGYLHMGPLTGAAWLLLSVHVVWTNGLQEDNISTGKLPARHTTWKKIHTTVLWKAETIETFKSGKIEYTIQMHPPPKKHETYINRTSDLANIGGHLQTTGLNHA